MSGGKDRAGTRPELSFGERLRERRRDAGLSQEQLAQRSGMSVRAINDIERGRTGCPRRSSVDLLARALGIRPSHLAQAAGEPGERAALEVHATSATTPRAPVRVVPTARLGAYAEACPPGPHGQGPMTVTIVLGAAHDYAAACDEDEGAMVPFLPSAKRGAAARLAARVIDTAERELGPGGGSVLLAALTRALSGRAVARPSLPASSTSASLQRTH